MIPDALKSALSDQVTVSTIMGLSIGDELLLFIVKDVPFGKGLLFYSYLQDAPRKYVLQELTLQCITLLQCSRKDSDVSRHDKSSLE